MKIRKTAHYVNIDPLADGRELIFVELPRRIYSGDINPADINWSAIGSTNIKTTKKFIKGLLRAIALAEKLNRAYGKKKK